MSDTVVVKSKIKDIAKNVNVASDFADALNEEVVKLVKKAEERALANGRKTIQPRDL